ncbi:multicopper oxidase domain-containing protein [Streptomyces sp. NPDC088360]|uniref:multicopper oxidase family protein n=1 Tax=Streptomyces sp. NPDC088360 TaxID=3154515 RepID=UPI00344E6D18
MATVRRRVLLSVGGVALVGGAGWGVNWLTAYSRYEQSNVGKLSFRNRLKFPELIDPKPDGAGRRHYSLRLAPGTRTFRRGQKTDTWGANGSYLAPTLRMRDGDEVSVAVANKLPERTTLHWHGMHLPAAMDGGPHQMIERDSTWRPRWSVHQPAATLWYHPHPHGSTGKHVYRGVAGMIIVDDEHSKSAGLPTTYGVDDLPLIIQDKNFHDDGQFDFTETSFSDDVAGVDNRGVLGDTILVNGVHDPYVPVSTERVRLRLLNASNARIYRIGFTDDRPFHLVAAENGLLRRPLELTRLRLAPGERAEVVVAFTPGTKTVLRSFPPDINVSWPTDRFLGGDDTFDLVEFRASARLRKSPELPTRFAGAPRPIELPKDPTVRKLSFVGVQINGKAMDLARIDEVVPAGATEVWEIERGDDMVHAVHVHGCTFNVIEVNGDKPPAHMTGPKDTVYLPVIGTVRLAVKFDSLTDTKTPYMFHCHVLRHEDDGMMGQFLVVEPGTEKQVSRRLTLDDSHDSH